MTDLHLLENIVWHTLSGPQSKYSVGTDDVRRYAVGFSPIIGFADQRAPNFAALTPFCSSDEHFYTDGWSGAVPDDWNIETESTMFKMVWEQPLPASDEALDAIPLGPEHAAQALELALLTRPGPFGLRTVELGEYFGYFEGTQIIAMAGERMHAGTLREISGVCTHPSAQGRGFARRLMTKLIRRQMLRGQTPFLHVMRENVTARALYERMGFRNYLKSVVRVISVR
jgi:ribosomal protein S18 acetylase RimI-like enzyme